MYGRTVRSWAVTMKNQFNIKPKEEPIKTMYKHASTIASELAWTGPLMCEFKVDTSDNIPKLMEINGRRQGQGRH